VSCGATSKARNMKESRRDFIKASLAVSVITVSRATTQPAQAAPKTIALVVSTKKKDDHEAAFMQALSDFHWYPAHNNNQHADGDYSKLKQDAKKVKNVDLIVAAGGLPAAIAVATALKEDNSSTRFVFLVGRYPQSANSPDDLAADLFNSSNKAGGVDQSMVTQNANNFLFLKAKGVTIDKVGLIVNDTNPITAPEVALWTAMADPPGSTNTPNSNFIYHLASNDNTGLTNLLSDINKPSKPNGIIVSSDAYLRSLGNVDFDTQLRTTGGFSGWVCYPFKEYVKASGANTVYSPSTPNLVASDPTDTKTSYYQLGLKAVDALIENPAKLATWTWNGSTGSWVDGNFPT
jgi:hypothetical protein